MSWLLCTKHSARNWGNSGRNTRAAARLGPPGRLGQPQSQSRVWGGRIQETGQGEGRPQRPSLKSRTCKGRILPPKPRIWSRGAGGKFGSEGRWGATGTLGAARLPLHSLAGHPLLWPPPTGLQAGRSHFRRLAVVGGTPQPHPKPLAVESPTPQGLAMCLPAFPAAGGKEGTAGQPRLRPILQGSREQSPGGPMPRAPSSARGL